MPKPTPSPQRTAAEAAAARSERRRAAVVAVVVVGVIAVPVAVSVVISWGDVSWPGRTSTPLWVALPQVRATTNDGVIVKARVAVDAPDSSAAIQRRTQQVGLVLEGSIAAHTRGQLAGAPGIARLSGDMEGRLNGYLADQGVAPVRSLAIQDLYVTPR
jgi:hypothetical protein